MKKNPVSFFEVPAADFKKAKEFYERVFDWNVELWGDEGAMALTTAADKDHNPIEPGGINGGFYKRKSKEDQPSFGVQTDSIDRTLAAIESGLQTFGIAGNESGVGRAATHFSFATKLLASESRTYR